MTKYSQSFVTALVFCTATGVAIPLLYYGLVDSPVTLFENYAVHIYGFCWYLVLGVLVDFTALPDGLPLLQQLSR